MLHSYKTALEHCERRRDEAIAQRDALKRLVGHLADDALAHLDDEFDMRSADTIAESLRANARLAREALAGTEEE